MDIDEKKQPVEEEEAAEEGGEYWNVQGKKRQRKETEHTVVEGVEGKKENERIGAKGNDGNEAKSFLTLGGVHLLGSGGP